ncbi:Outer membrane protein assembly factor BamB, contains PQQ-like beta-propeller repeat [Haladaptatus litoreus]|uniref:Outer membrane protein assembly factor BamB, contains PQQ-like beta-propeller repeat n=1 Tax=Haladaptatus litoreus TaxID=553468 RepID=A0A1N6VZS5_9EURY|nr:PQQ-binding-like beta-propeller repeat protein [Haladaptatus litoreus]SIQ83371.1 Outer membrane protein assembly factor BamB, contains PQQ-like beta-propeller repeat [Haladaptatus litoreus]
MVRPSDETRRTFLKLTGVALGTAGLSGTVTSDAQSSAQQDWPTFQYDAGNTGYNPVGGDPGSGAWIAWSEHVCDRRLFAPTVVDGTAYVVDTSGVLTAFDTETRETRWTANVRGLDYAPTVLGDTVYVAGTDILALSTSNGSKRWRFEIGVTESSPITTADGTLFFKTSDANGQGICWAIDAETGTERWRIRIPSGKEGEVPSAENVPPAVVDGVAYFVDKSDVYAFEAETGNPRWQTSVDGAINHAPTVANGTVYVCGERVFALSADDGATDWETSVAESALLAQSPAILDDSVIITDGREARAWSLHCENGAKQWSFEDGGDSAGTPVIADGTVYIPISGDDALVAVDVATGEQRWRVPIRNLGNSWLPAAVGDDIYVTDREGFLYAIRDSARLDWRADRTGTLAVGENVYLANDELVAFDSETGETRWTVDDGSAPTAENELLYVADGENVVAYTADGSQQWRAECDGEIATELAVTDEAVFVGGDGWIDAFDAKTGAVQWRYRGDCGNLGSVTHVTARENRAFAVMDGRVLALESGGVRWVAGENVCVIASGDAVYTGTDENEVVAYDFDGNELWRVTPENGESISHLVTGEAHEDGVYAVTTSVTSIGTDSREWLTALHDGEERWSFHPKFLPFGSLCEPVVADDTVYVGASDRRVYALSAADGSELRRFETGGEVRSVAVDADEAGDRVYAASDFVYAFE